MNDSLQAIRADGQYQAISNRHFPATFHLRMMAAADAASG
jgi:ABC-type amino acid transport substrate-binding protein